MDSAYSEYTTALLQSLNPLLQRRMGRKEPQPTPFPWTRDLKSRYGRMALFLHFLTGSQRTQSRDHRLLPSETGTPTICAKFPKARIRSNYERPQHHKDHLKEKDEQEITPSPRILSSITAQPGKGIGEK